jgi:HD-GYP domain-containing protein (c-di-GMP phosphodiesterase class II)
VSALFNEGCHTLSEARARGPFQDTSLAFKLYYGFVVGLGVVLAVRFFPTARIDSWSTLLWWFAFAFVAELSPIVLPGSQAYITVSSALDYAAIVVFGPVVAAMIAAVTSLVSSFAVSRQSVHKALFNVCLFISTIMLSGFVFTLLGGHATPDISQLVLPMVGCGITYFLLDTFGVSVIVALSQKLNAWRIWQRTYLWTTITHLVGFVPLGAIIVVIFMHIGIPGVALFLVPLMLARYSFKLYTDMREVHIETVKALTSAIDASDPFTRGHSERVTRYSVAMAREMRLGERRIQALEYAGFLHDMGKIGIQHDILLKPGALTDAEWREMREHPAVGARIVSDLDFLRGAREVVLHHHERYDGTGYPTGLAGDDIPLEARIAKVADAFDAMMSDRPYRTSLGLEKSLAVLIKGKGSEFDPAVVDAFLRLVDSGDIDPNGQDNS